MARDFRNIGNKRRESDQNKVPNDASSDGRFLLFRSNGHTQALTSGFCVSLEKNLS